MEAELTINPLINHRKISSSSPACTLTVAGTRNGINTGYTIYKFKITETTHGQEHYKRQKSQFWQVGFGFRAHNSFVNCRTSHAVSFVSGSADGFWV
jgi:hypothetical protein